MRPLTLVLAGVVAVAAAYAVFFWRNASDVREQLEIEQAAEREMEELRPGDPRSGLSRGNQPTPSASNPVQLWRPRGQTHSLTDTTEAVTEFSDPSGSTFTSDGNQAVAAGAESTVADSLSEVAERKEDNYSGLQRTGLQIASAVQRQMREGEILVRGRGIGSALLQYVGYPVDQRGDHITADGNFSVEIKGPDLIVVTATSEEFGNQMEVSVFGPREVDRRVRRVR